MVDIPDAEFKGWFAWSTIKASTLPDFDEVGAYLLARSWFGSSE